MLRRHSRRLLLVACLTAVVAAVLANGLFFVAGHRLPPPRQAAVSRAAGTAIAPAPVKETLRPEMPSGIDERRYHKEGVRWLMDEEQVGKPPAWHVLLLKESYEKPRNTIKKVAASLAIVLGLAAALAERKAVHAKEHYFADVHESPEYGESVSIAQELKSRGLVVRVVPGVKPAEGSSKDSSTNDREPEKTPAGTGAGVA